MMLFGMNLSSGMCKGDRVMLVALPFRDGEEIARLLVRMRHPKLLTFHGFVQVIALDVVAALVHLHESDESPYQHLSTHTIWLTNTGRAKLSLVSGVQPSETVWQPESPSQERSTSTDVYAFGVLLLTLQHQSVPSIGDVVQARSLMADGDMEILSIDWSRLSCPEKLRTLTSQCVQLDASRRPRTSDIYTAIRTMMEEVLEAEMASDVQSTVFDLSVLESIVPASSSADGENPGYEDRDSEQTL
ncbi:hypothetical protein AC1031_000454 [Aphanomyces cochlioides]|nr:hypothetical protein AC1031_000454 [Aphanomyces cochlioides]